MILLQSCLVITVKAQEGHDVLREKYLSFSEDSLQTNSTIYYAFKVRDAALKESGKHSLNYFRSLNNIGVAYNLKEINDSAGFTGCSVMNCYKKKRSIISSPPKPYFTTI